MQNKQINWQERLKQARIPLHRLDEADLVLPAKGLSRIIMEIQLHQINQEFIKLVREYMPADGSLTYYIDYSNSCFAVLPLFKKGRRSVAFGDWPLDQITQQELDLTLFGHSLRRFLLAAKLQQDPVVPELYVYRANYLREIHTFMYKILPLLLSLGQAWGTDAVMDLIFRKDLPLKLGLEYNKSARQLEVFLQMEQGFTSEELLEMVTTAEDEKSTDYFEGHDGTLYDLGDIEKQGLFWFFSDLGWSESDLLQQKKIHPLPEIPQVMYEYIELVSAVYHGSQPERIWHQVRQEKPLRIDLMPRVADKPDLWPKEALEFLADQFSAGLGGLLLAKEDELFLALALQLAGLVQNQYKDSQALLLTSPARLARLDQLAGELFPDLEIRLIQGPAEARRQVLAQKPASACLYITTYTLLVNDLEYYAGQYLDLLLLFGTSRLEYESRQVRAIRQLKTGSSFILAQSVKQDPVSQWCLASLIQSGLFAASLEDFLAEHEEYPGMVYGKFDPFVYYVDQDWREDDDD